MFGRLVIIRRRHHHAVMTGHVRHHLVARGGLHVSPHVTWLCHRLKPKGKRGDEPKHRCERTDHGVYIACFTCAHN